MLVFPNLLPFFEMDINVKFMFWWSVYVWDTVRTQPNLFAGLQLTSVNKLIMVISAGKWSRNYQSCLISPLFTTPYSSTTMLQMWLIVVILRAFLLEMKFEVTNCGKRGPYGPKATDCKPFASAGLKMTSSGNYEEVGVQEWRVASTAFYK